MGGSKVDSCVDIQLVGESSSSPNRRELLGNLITFKFVIKQGPSLAIVNMHQFNNFQWVGADDHDSASTRNFA